MSKQKSLSQLEAEKAACERQLVQLQHKVQQYENRIACCGKGERRKRTHRLITRGAIVRCCPKPLQILPSKNLPCFFGRSRGGFLTVRLPSKYRPDSKHDARDHGLMHQINKQRLSAAGSQEGDHATAGIHPGKL